MFIVQIFQGMKKTCSVHMVQNTWKQAVRLHCILARFKIIMEYLRLSRWLTNQFIQPAQYNRVYKRNNLLSPIMYPREVRKFLRNLHEKFKNKVYKELRNHF